jgi:hypothetical protein
MSYKELKEFLKQSFPDNSGQIMDLALRAASTSDIDSATDAKKRLFANYVLKEQMDFSPQKNRDIYEKLIKVIGLPPTQNVVEYVLLLKSIGKKEESMIMTSFQNFWSQVEKGYSKYEIIINLYLEKGIQAEVSGEDRQKVRAIVDSAIHGLKHDIRDAYLKLLDELYLKRFLKKKEFHCDKIFENLVNASYDEHPDKYSMLLIKRFSALLGMIDSSFIARLKHRWSCCKESQA